MSFTFLREKLFEKNFLVLECVRSGAARKGWNLGGNSHTSVASDWTYHFAHTWKNIVRNSDWTYLFFTYEIHRSLFWLARTHLRMWRYCEASKSAKYICSLFGPVWQTRSSSPYYISSCRPIYHDKLVILNFCSHSAKLARRHQTIWYGKVCRRVATRRQSRNENFFFVECRFLNSFKTVREHIKYSSFD